VARDDRKRVLPGNKARVLYAQWVRQHATELYRFGYRMCGDAETAEDLVQETFHEAWKCMGRLRETERARAWLFQILRHRYMRWRRSERRSGAIRVPIDAIPAEHLEHRGATSPDVPDEALKRALDGLTDRLREPLLLVFMAGMTCQEAADRLDLPLGTVLSRIHRAKRHIRSVMKESSPVSRRATDEAASTPRFRTGGEP
jgi:RNA polymerase sigma-70 factor (ECF subfamily)